MSKTTHYDLHPRVDVQGTHAAWRGYAEIRAAISDRLCGTDEIKQILVIDTYPGVDMEELRCCLVESLRPDLLLFAEDCCYPAAEVEHMLREPLTEDRVFGRMNDLCIGDFFDAERLEAARRAIQGVREGLVIIYGPGAAQIDRGNVLVYADMARWEIQQRYRSGRIGNWLAGNAAEDALRKYKRGFFVDWRVHDRHKVPLLQRMDFLLDTNRPMDPRMAEGEAVREGLWQCVRRPFRVEPFFDPGVWGGQWMKEHFGLPEDAPNYAWCFDCVPEENSLLLGFGEVTVQLPAMDLVLLEPLALLGNAVYARFGAEFPIRFDMLDTMGGQNLSLQVHPTTRYIREQFGMPYTQDESYYLLDAGMDAKVYLGLKEDVALEEFAGALECAQQTAAFDEERFLNAVPAKAHDHFLIPAGTVHGAGASCMVLEISATPFIFTFKLWDWGRLGLDGKPRPIHIMHGLHNIDAMRDARWVATECVNRFEVIGDGEEGLEERTGLHPLEFIETRRHTFSAMTEIPSLDSVQVMNLVQGEEAVITSPEGRFEPFQVHYAETFILPAEAGSCRIEPLTPGEVCRVIRAYVREGCEDGEV